MKIFSLETKKHLVGWSLGFSLLIGYLLSIKVNLDVYNCYSGEDCEKFLERHEKFQNNYF